jgi:hypothetical protein
MGEVAHKQSLKVGLTRMIVKDKPYDLEACIDWDDNQALDNDVEIGKLYSFLPNQFKILTTLNIHEGLVLELVPQFGETPLKGGLGVKDILSGEVFPGVLDLRESLEGTGCLVEGVGDDCPVDGAWLGEVDLPVRIVVDLGKGKRPVQLLDGSDIKENVDSAGENVVFFYCALESWGMAREV